MALDTIAVTGGSGLIGAAILAELSGTGYRTVNIDRESPADETGGAAADEFLAVDLLDAGEVYGALAKHDVDAVIHMGTIKSPVHHPGHVTFASNVMTSYNVLEAAKALGLEAVCLASSINAMGYSVRPVPPEIDYLPVDEDHPRRPRNPYALGKAVTEEIADGFGRQSARPTTIGTVRYPVVLPSEALQERFATPDRSLDVVRSEWDPAGPSNDLFAYIHVVDAARIAKRIVEADFEGHETFWAVADDTTADVPTEELVEEFHPDVEIRSPFGDHESLISTAKAKTLLDWEPRHSWRDL